MIVQRVEKHIIKKSNPYYNKKYNIDRADPDYVPGYNETKEIEFERAAKAFEEFKQLFKGTSIASEYPELFEVERPNK